MSAFNDTADDAFNDTFADDFNDTYYYNYNFHYHHNRTYSNNTYTEPEEKVETLDLSFYTPFLYLGILIVSLLIFSRRYRQNRIKKLSQLRSVFDEHYARDLYVELKEIRDSGEAKVDDKALKAALLNRGAEAIRRSFKVKELGPQVELLYKNGSIGEDYWERFQNEKKLVELELKEAIQEAEVLQPGWPKTFVPLCQEICFNQAMMRRYQSIAKRKEVCIQEWDLELNEDGTLKK